MSSPTRRPSPRPRPGPPAGVEPATPGAASPDVPLPDGPLSDGPAADGRQPQSQPKPRNRARRIVAATRSATTASAADSRQIWRDSRTARQERREQRTEPRFDSSSWLGAIVVMTVFTAGVWALQIVNAQRHYSLNRFGLVPRTLHGLWGVLLSPVLHGSYGDMASDTLPLLLIGWVVLLAGARIWAAVTVVVVLVGGALTWLAGPDQHTVIIGSSGLVFGWLGYLVARAVFSRKIKWIVAAAMVLLVFGTLLGQLVPVAHSHEPWQLHLASLLAGVGIGALLHPRRRSARAARARTRASAVS